MVTKFSVTDAVLPFLDRAWPPGYPINVHTGSLFETGLRTLEQISTTYLSFSLSLNKPPYSATTHIMLTEVSRGIPDSHLDKTSLLPPSLSESGLSAKAIESDAVVKPVSGLGSLATTSSSLPTPEDGSEPNRTLVVGGQGNYLHLADGRKILDACGGAAVAVSKLSRLGGTSPHESTGISLRMHYPYPE